MHIATHHVRAVHLAVAAAAVLILTLTTLLPVCQLELDMSSIYDASPVTFSRFVCCNCYDCCPNWIDGTFFGTRRAAELHISRRAMCRTAGKGVRVITSEYRQSNWVEDHEAGPVGGAGTWPVRPAAGAGPGGAAGMAYRTLYRLYIENPVYRYIPIVQRLRGLYPSFWHPTSVYADIGCQYRLRYRRKTRYRGYIGWPRRGKFEYRISISKVFYSISGVDTRYRGYIGLAKSVKFEYRIRYRIFFLRYRMLFFDIEVFYPISM